MRVVVMVIEDNDIINTMLGRLLRSHGCSVHCFTDPIKALEQVENVRPDVFLIDKGLPSMSGVEVVKLVKRSFCRPQSSKVIAFSGHMGAGEEMLAAGADVFISKPFGKQQVVGAIESALGIVLDPRKSKKR